MKITGYFFLFSFLISTISWGQNEEIMIGPCQIHSQPEPIIILDGIRLSSPNIGDLLGEENSENIKSVSIQPDSIFDCNKQLKNLGVVKIETKDSLNREAKKIRELTDNWIYNHPLTELEINNKMVAWNDDTYHRLISMEAGDILSVKINHNKDDCNSKIALKIKE